MDKLERIFGIQKDFTEKFFKDKHGLTVDDVVKDKELKIKWNKE